MQKHHAFTACTAAMPGARVKPGCDNGPSSETSAAAATLEHSPGTTVETFVTFLTAEQLKRMHETEGAYFLNELTNLDLHVGLSLEAFR